MRSGGATVAAAMALLLAVVAVVYVGHSAAETRELMGKGDEWIAKEDGMALDVADEIAKRWFVSPASRVSGPCLLGSIQMRASCIRSAGGCDTEGAAAP